MALNPTLTTAAVAAGVGLVGGIVAERTLSPESIQRDRDANRWNALHEDFLAEHPTPAGTRLFVNSEPAWKNAALVGGAAAGVGALGAGAIVAATKLPSQPFLLAAAGVSVAALGAGELIGTGLSWIVR